MLTAVNTIMNRLEWAMLVTLSVLWGGSFFFTEIALESLPPLTIVTLRVGLAAITLWLVVLALKLPIPNSTPIWIAFLTMGLLNNVLPFSLLSGAKARLAQA